MRAWNYAAKNQFRLEACRRLGIHAVTARQVGPLLEQFLRIAKDEGLDTAAARGQGRGAAEVHPHRLQRPRGAAAGQARCAANWFTAGAACWRGKAWCSSSPLFVAAEVREVGRRGGEIEHHLSLATAIEPDWLRGVVPGGHQARGPRASTTRRPSACMAAELLRFRDLALRDATRLNRRRRTRPRGCWRRKSTPAGCKLAEVGPRRRAMDCCG